MRPHLKLPLISVLVVFGALGTACSSPSVPGADQPKTAVQDLAAGLPQSAQDAAAAVRARPVVVGRAARMFVFAGFGPKCEPVAAPDITITLLPQKGDVSFVPGQETTVNFSAKGTCIGEKVTGTGVYYTARAGATGVDRFTVIAKLASGASSTRTFEVKIAE